jgi:hypothetical protein
MLLAMPLGPKSPLFYPDFWKHRNLFMVYLRKYMRFVTPVTNHGGRALGSAAIFPVIGKNMWKAFPL